MGEKLRMVKYLVLKVTKPVDSMADLLAFSLLVWCSTLGRPRKLGGMRLGLHQAFQVPLEAFLHF